MGNLDEVMKKLKSRQTVTEDLDEVEKTPEKEEKTEEKVEEIDDDLENDEEDVDLEEEDNEVVEKVEKKPVTDVKKTTKKPSEVELHEQKTREIAILQDAGVFRSELLIQLAKVNENLYALNYLIDKAIGGKA